MGRFGLVTPETDLERQQFEINHKLVAMLNGLPVGEYKGRALLFCTESQPTRARRDMFGWRGFMPADTPIYDVPGWHENALLGDGIDRITEVLAAQATRLK